MPLFRFAPAYPAHTVLVEAADKTVAAAIFEYHTSSSAEDVPVEELTGKLHGRNKPVRAEDCTISLIGGYYTLQFRELDGWADVARVKFGPLWTTIWQQAVIAYGEENVRATFTLSAGWDASTDAKRADDDDYDYDY